MNEKNILISSVKTKNIKKSKNKKSEKIFLFCMLILPILQWLIFWLYVNTSSIGLAFKDVRTEEFTLNNFVKFWESLTSPYGEIGIALKNTLLYFTTSLFIIMPIALMISYFLYKKIALYKAYRILFYLPAIISGVAMVATFTNFIDPRGPLGVIAKFFGLKIAPEGLLANNSTATPTILVYCIWTGFCTNILLFNGAMVRVPIEVLESAALEGCGTMRELCQLILPLIWPTMSTQIVFAFTGIFTASGPILLFTNGSYETTTISFWIFQQVYGSGALGGTGSYNLVSATGLCFTILGVPIILFVRWLMERIPSVEY